MSDGREPRGIDVSIPSPARLYNYYLGGKDNFAADRVAAEAILAVMPEGRQVARENRAFLRRVVRHLAVETGIRQFVDLGTGLPTQGNVHEVAQEVDPDARVVYVDNDPIVQAHGEALLARNGNTTFVEADLRRPEAILSHPGLNGLIDFSRPVAVLFVSVLQFVPDDEEAAGLVRNFRNALAPGSHVVISTITGSGQDEEKVETITEAYRNSTAPAVLRTRPRIERLFGDLDLVAPGLVPAPEWHPDVNGETAGGTSWVLAGVGRV
ncbi:SAM-dependent methyltransferase [Actinomadura sp. DC4]|uniref:SAM-dependent methyltransferase n=1 Tax=Actinomadura sp. DC4 TaxID=3055069 RepID=UPI0025AFB2E1|nr:SAM-dependent methyltransferase [Actinomadura sp. DC4]MDN3352102.1 SAM-dependent methyltransferase [Actinomadura sp. DC4]